MLDIGWTELILVAVILILVVGPKDLPVVMRTFGRMVGRMRAMGREFTQTFEEVAREAELEELTKTANSIRTMNVKNELQKKLDPEMDKPVSSQSASTGAANDPVTPSPAPAPPQPAAEAVPDAKPDPAESKA